MTARQRERSVLEGQCKGKYGIAASGCVDDDVSKCRTNDHAYLKIKLTVQARTLIVVLHGRVMLALRAANIDRVLEDLKARRVLCRSEA